VPAITKSIFDVLEKALVSLGSKPPSGDFRPMTALRDKPDVRCKCTKRWASNVCSAGLNGR